ncbi:hypothetical protein ACOMHN_042931 [Nucella lapillus]
MGGQGRELELMICLPSGYEPCLRDCPFFIGDLGGNEGGIGVGEWDSEYARPCSHYLKFLETLVNLRVNIVAFADSVAASTIPRLLGKVKDMTHGVELPLQDLPYYHLKDHFQRIMTS